MESTDFNENNCVICLGDFSTNIETATVVTKGISSLIEFSKQRGDVSLQAHLEKQNGKEPLGRVLVHAKCRRAYVDPKRAKRSSTAGPQTTPKKLKLRSNQPTFRWKTRCFFCDEKVCFDSQHPDRYPESRRVGGKEESVLLINKIRKRCEERDDNFGSNVRKRLSVCTDLVADEAVYHVQCHAKFFLDKPKDVSDRVRGRPECPKMQAVFNQTCDWLENEIELFTLEDFRVKMKEVSDEEVYGVKRIKQKLQDRYKDNIFFAEVSGRKNVVCFRNMASWIVSDQWYKNKVPNADDEAKRIIETAAKIIKNDLKEFLQSKCSTTCYPSIDDVSIGWIPDHLRIFLSSFIHSELKIETIGQCLMKAAMPRSVMPPILFALAVESDHMFASRWLNTQLFSLGFAESYNEVVRFKQGVVMTEDIEDILQSRASKDSFTTFVADNVDHNIATLDGKGTFHGMGVIAVITNKEDFNAKQPVRLRPTSYTKVDELVKRKGIPITSYDYPSQRGLDTIIFKPYDNIMSFFTDRISSDMDQLWHAAGLFSTTAEPRPNWNGFMQDVTKGDHPPRSDTVMLPIIDLNPNDETCIYSTLLFVIEQSKKLNVTTPSITFDQPLWLKALEIITAKELNIVPLLGGFHMLMSFYGSIGNIMAGSGIDKLFENIYGQNAVKHMLSGKAVARANRAHILTESALLIKLQRMALSENSNEEGVNNVNLEVIQTLYKTVLSKIEDVDIEIPAMHALKTILEETKKSLWDKSRTARLWLQYIEYVETCRNFIRAARTGNWNLHLYAISKMINLYAATGHINYAKSARIYLQLMLDLQNTHPWLYHKFSEEGLFVVRRSDRFWAGLWPDLTIEQVMMRALKSRGGLTRGSGFTESVRTLWIYSMHATASYHDALSSLTKNQNKTSEQHQDLGKSRLQRDYNDLQKLITWLDYQSHDPFDANRTKLQALDSGLIADESVTCDDAESIGMCIQQSLDNVLLSEASVKRSHQAVTLASLKPSIKVGNQNIVIDPMVLFSRLIVLLQRNDDIASYFAYELAPVPTALFKDNMMRKPTKSALAKALDVKCENAKKAELNVSITIDGVNLSDDDNEMNKSFTESEEDDDGIDDGGDETVEGCNEQNVERYVIDGGYLLRRVVWDKQSTYQEIIQKYISYVESHYGKCSIVFDGYQDGPSIKDHEHFRRLLKASVSPNVSVHMENSIGSTSQEAFLSNTYNKQCLIDLLAVALESNGHSVVKCNNDADTAIVSTVLDYACENNNVSLVAADTDLLIMLLYMWNDSMGRIIMKSEGSKRHKETIRDIGMMAESLEDVRKYLTLIHAFGGCDTTSASFGLGKMSIMKLIEKCNVARDAADVFLSSSSSPEAVGEAGLKLFAMLYSGKVSDTLASLRYIKYMKMASSSTAIKPESMPPSERAAYFHALRVYLQVQEWNTLQESNLNPENWGWRLEESSFVPIMTDECPAPDELLNVIRCNCQLTSKNPCGGKNCSCRANGLNCVAVCGDCRGTDCMNIKTNAIPEESVEYDEEYEGNIFENIFGI